MPLRPEVRPLYGHAWRKYRLVLIELAKNRCSKCGRVFPSDQLTGAHLLHDPKERELTVVMCFPCHARHDAPQRHAMTRRTRARRYGQLWLLPEIEYAPFPAWEIPTSVIEALQGKLFPSGFEFRQPEALDRGPGSECRDRDSSVPV